MGELLLGWWIVRQLRPEHNFEGADALAWLCLLPFLVFFGSPLLVWEAVRQRTLSRWSATFWCAVYLLVLALIWVVVDWWVALLAAAVVGLVALWLVDRAARREQERERAERAAEDYYYGQFS